MVTLPCIAHILHIWIHIHTYSVKGEDTYGPPAKGQAFSGGDQRIVEQKTAMPNTLYIDTTAHSDIYTLSFRPLLLLLILLPVLQVEEMLQREQVYVSTAPRVGRSVGPSNPSATALSQGVKVAQSGSDPIGTNLTRLLPLRIWRATQTRPG